MVKILLNYRSIIFLLRFNIFKYNIFIDISKNSPLISKLFWGHFEEYFGAFAFSRPQPQFIYPGRYFGLSDSKSHEKSTNYSTTQTKIHNKPSKNFILFHINALKVALQSCFETFRHGFLYGPENKEWVLPRFSPLRFFQKCSKIPKSLKICQRA